MWKSIITTILFASLTIASWYAEVKLEFTSLERITRSLLTLTIVYSLFGLIINSVVIKQIKDAKSAYKFRKTVDIVFYIIIVLALFRIWIEDPQALLVSYGIVAAGATIALQDLIKNIAGGIVIIVNDLFRVGDRIEVDDKIGDVIDIGLFNTTILEIKNWVSGDQPTGRIASMPNGMFLSKTAINYTRDHEFIWDEIMIPVTYDSDWKKANKLLKQIAKRRTDEFIKLADKQLKRLSRKFYIAERETSPQIFVNPTDNWIELTIRYITPTKSRRLTYTNMTSSILTTFSNHQDIKIASATIDIIGFPKTK